MPYKSRAQERYFHYLESKGKLPKKTVDDFDEASKGLELPQKLYDGGTTLPSSDEFDSDRDGFYDKLDDFYHNLAEESDDAKAEKDDLANFFHGGIVPGEYGEQDLDDDIFGYKEQDKPDLEDEDEEEAKGYAKGGMIKGDKTALMNALLRRSR